MYENTQSVPATGPGTNTTVEEISNQGSDVAPDERVVGGGCADDIGADETVGVETALDRLSEEGSVREILKNGCDE